MKAVVYSNYGTPDVLQLKEVEKPVPGDNEVLVKVHSVSVNDWDMGLLQGLPFVNRLPSGIFKPQFPVLGSDIAGRVESVGTNVNNFRPGDAVFGDLAGHWGGFAEYVCARESALALKPVAMSFDQAAAIPQAALLALQGLSGKRKIKPGQKVLINGAGGGSGTFAIQIAKSSGAKVTGIDRTDKLETMRSTGADNVIDYTREDFTRNGSFDLIIDFAAHRSVFDYRRALNPGGAYVMVGGASSRILQLMFLGPFISMSGSRKMGLLMHKPNKGLPELIELFEAGKVVPVIDKTYSLSEVPEAMRYFGEGRPKGKIVITIINS